MSTFWIYKRSDGDIGWRLRDGNQKIIAISGEGFKTETAARQSIANVKVEVPSSNIKISEKHPI